MFLHVARGEYIADYRIHLWFNDGSAGEVDLAGSLDGPIFVPLGEIGNFKQFRIEGHTLSWDNGADFAPEYLHELLHANATA